MASRQELQTRLDNRVAELRGIADDKQAAADRLQGTINRDHAFWTQPAYSNAGGRAFARSRDKERSKVIKAGEIAGEARAIRDKASAMEARGVVVVGDAAAARDAKVQALIVQVGQAVDTTHYGIRKVLKVNAKTVNVEGAFGPLKINKEFIRVIAQPFMSVAA